MRLATKKFWMTTPQMVALATISGGAAPMNYLTAQGQKAATVLPLTWAVTLVSIAVIAIILSLVAVGSWRRGAALPTTSMRDLPVGSGDSGLPWIYIGVGISTIVLLATLLWTMWVLVKTYMPASAPAFTVVITGHQWWWEAEYKGKTPSETFTTANEIHIPTGVPVKFELKSADVIHSFWVPPLNGKTDTIPGQTNITWMDASHPGVFRGQCTEYCGWQHAKMALFVIAQPPQQFKAWWQHQLQGAPEPGSAAITEARSTFVLRCGSCHSVRGTDAGGVLGPDLSHLMSRMTIAAGMLPNTPGNLSAWIADPQSIKPGSLMPALGLTPPELAQVRAYLGTLK